MKRVTERYFLPLHLHSFSCWYRVVRSDGWCLRIGRSPEGKPVNTGSPVLMKNSEALLKLLLGPGNANYVSWVESLESPSDCSNHSHLLPPGKVA